MPKVVGKSLRKAKARIRKAHCRVGKVTYKVSTKKRKGLVVAQRPKPRTRLGNGAKIRLTIGKGPGTRRR